MTDPIGAVRAVSSVSHDIKTPALVDNFDSFLKGLSGADVDSNKVMSDLTQQMATIDKNRLALMDPAIYGALGQRPGFQRVMALKRQMQVDLSEITKTNIQMKIEASITGTKINYFTTALGRMSKGINQLLQSS